MTLIEEFERLRVSSIVHVKKLLCQHYFLSLVNSDWPMSLYSGCGDSWKMSESVFHSLNFHFNLIKCLSDSNPIWPRFVPGMDGRCLSCPREQRDKWLLLFAPLNHNGDKCDEKTCGRSARPDGVMSKIMLLSQHYYCNNAIFSHKWSQPVNHFPFMAGVSKTKINKIINK